MARHIFYRNVQASGYLDTFLVSAITSLLGLRFFLQVTGYPTVGVGGLHIAHMLWGGLLMMAAIVILVSFLGARQQRIAVIVGGIGFGMFIDELGKFITSDNNYFFQPTIGIIYAIFVILYLTTTFLSRDYQKLSSREYQLNALMHIQEAILHDMDHREKQEAQLLLEKANGNSRITRELMALLATVDTVPVHHPNALKRLVAHFDDLYQRFWQGEQTAWRVRLFFLAEAIVFLVGAIYMAWGSISDLRDVLYGDYAYSKLLLAGELASAAVASVFVVWGAGWLVRSRLRAFELFRRATIINMYLTQFFQFSREGFGALPGFVTQLALLLVITYVIHQERTTRRNENLTGRPEPS